MKKNLVKFASLTAVFALGIGLAVNTQKQPIAVEAAQHTANYADFTYSGSYYNTLNTSGTDGLTGTFQSALSSLIYPKAWYTYTGGGGNANYLSGALQEADEDPTNSSNMVYLYTRDSVKKNAAESWNREHVWPQSCSGTNPTTHDDNWGTTEAGTDILHLRPTYNSTNSKRGNKKYGYISGSKTAEQYNGMDYGYTSGNYFEPLDAVKGDVARIVMYIYVAYNAHYGNSLNILDTFASYNTLLQWHTADKPDVLEGNRNAFSEASKQKNRNPFVDHPEYAWRIFGDSCSESVKNACMEAYPGEGGQTPPTKTLESIAISGTATKTAYYAGDSFNPAGLTVTATYSDASTDTIPTSNCTWTPNPLTVGTTSVTCTFNGKTATYSGITVTQKQVSADGYSVTFSSNGSDGSSELKNSSAVADCFESNTLIESSSSMTKVFAGASGLKLGNSSTAGSITFTLKQEVRTNIAKIKIESEQFNNDTGKLVLKLDSKTIKDDITPGVDAEIDLDNASATTMTISTTAKRAYLSKITVTLAAPCTHQFGEWTVKTAPTCLEAGVEHRVCSLCGEEETRAVEALGHKAADAVRENEVAATCTEPGSYDEVIYCERCQAEMSREHKTIDALGHQFGEWTVVKDSTTTETGTEHRVCSVCGHEETREIPVKTADSSEPPVDNPTEPTVEPQPEEEKGCGGSIIATTSLFAISALAGLSFIFIKRRRY